MNARCIGCVCLLCFSLLFAGQNRPAGQSEPASPASATRQITLDVVVTDTSGTQLRGLEQRDFTLLDNKQPQKITSFRAVEGGTATADPPVEVVLLVDEVNASFTRVASARTEIVKFLGRNGGQLALPVSMVFLTDSGTTIGKTSSRDGNVLIAELNQTGSGLRTIGRSQGFYGAQERLGLCLHSLGQFADDQAARPGRKLVVWISPGWPLFSGPGVDLSSKAQQWVFESIVALSDRLRRARITLYIVDPLGLTGAGGFRTAAYKLFLKPVTTVRQARLGNLGLQILAHQSGGLVLNSSNDVAGEIARCFADANAFYVLSFDGLAGDGPNEYHAIDVKVDRPGLAARTRSGYYAQPE
ncbi:MAG TPA: VWA domain-containing protein [Bryobacteraceae bacterium]